jgi:serine/threonine protein kinase
VAERDSLDSLPTGTLGQYRVRARIGSGGMGEVFDAVHVTLGKRVAIKTLRRRFLDDEIVVARFLREGQLASRMRHPNIVDVTDVGVIDGLPCLVMEHLEGETLSQVIRRDGPMKPSGLVDHLLPIIAAVDFAHDHGVLHRDLKPSNIFLARSWNGEMHPKVLDFGISKLVHESAEAALTTDSAFVGTPHYASPESVRAEKAADRRSDQYSMGVILYEGTTGIRPFADKGGSFVTMAMAICNGDFPPPRAHKPELPESFERVVLRAMALHADDRFLGMRELGAALLPFASERARVIWAPTFEGAGARDALDHPSSPETQVLRTSVGMHANAGANGNANAGANAGANPSSIPGRTPYSGTGPAMPPQDWPPGSVHQYPAAHGLPSISGLPSGGPAPSIHTASGHQQHFVPMGAGMHDRTPSFGSGIGSSIPAGTPPKRGSAALVTVAVLALVGAGLIGVALSRMSAKRAAAATDGDTTAAPAGATFAVDVQTTPETAVFELDGVSVGSGRLERHFARDGQKHVLRVSAPGYETLLVSFDETHPPPNIIGLHASPGGAASSALAGRGPADVAPKPSATVAAPGPAAGARPGPAPGPNVKPKPDRPRTDNIDPWE